MVHSTTGSGGISKNPHSQIMKTPTGHEQTRPGIHEELKNRFKIPRRKDN